MLLSLSVRNVVLIERLEISFKPGLCVLTGETGAGKSILLDALGLALGMRADAGLVRRSGRGGEPITARVSAAFSLPVDHPVLAAIAEQGLDAPSPGEPLILRRTVSADGRSRAFVHDQPVAVQLLRAIGESLVAVIGQFASQDLGDGAGHRAALDDFAALARPRAAVAAACRAWRDADAALAEAGRAADGAVREEVWLRHAVEELDALAPEAGEEEALDALRQRLRHAERLAEAVAEAIAALDDSGGARDRLGAAHRALDRGAGFAGGVLDPALEALDRASTEAAEARAAIARAVEDMRAEPDRLEAAEERLFALRALARKHGVAPDALAGLREELAARLALVEDRAGALAALAKTAADAKTAFLSAARALSRDRGDAAARLDQAVRRELRPLRLGAARFVTVVETLPETGWGPHGIDRVEFTASTSAGAAPGRLSRIASGGELARFMLALKVVTARTDSIPTLVFDEVDSGIGGATSAAVGERLRRLGRAVQVLVVTHSPQVAALGVAHWRVHKREARRSAGRQTTTVVDELDAEDRREEIARMLAGARITDEARAAADSLIAGGPS